MTGGSKLKPSAGNKTGFFYGYIIVVVAFFIQLVCYGIHFAFGVFFKPMMLEFGWTRAMMSGAFSVAWIITGVATIAMGGLNDRLGPRIVSTICGALIGMGYLLMSQVKEAWQLYLFYGVIVGAGLGISVPLMSTIARWFTRQRSMMTGILVAGTGVGALIGPPISDYLIKAYDWRISYLILGSVVLLIVIPIAQFLKRDPSQVKQITSYGETSRQEELESDTIGFSLKKAAGTRQFWLTFVIFFCLGFLLYAIQIHLAPHATDIGFSTTTAAAILAVMGGTSIVGRVVLGIAGDKIGNKSGFIIGFCLMSVASLWLIFPRDEWGLFLFAAVFGIAYGGCVAQQSPLIANLFGLRSHGLLMGVNSFGFTIGAAIGPLITGYMFDVSGNYRFAFLVCVMVGILGFILTITLRPINPDGAKHLLS